MPQLFTCAGLGYYPHYNNGNNGRRGMVGTEAPMLHEKALTGTI
jgi:hypothetical protein